MWEEVEHTADWSIHVWAEDLRSLFEESARGMVSLLGESSQVDQGEQSQTFELTAPDLETLLVDWLTELVWLIEEESLAFASIDVHTVESSPPYIAATIEGKSGVQYGKHIKAVTYHNLAIKRTANRYETTLVFDV